MALKLSLKILALLVNLQLMQNIFQNCPREKFCIEIDKNAMDSIVRVLLYAQDFAEKFIFFPRAGLLAEQCNMQKVLSNFFTGITHWNLINKTSLE